MLKITRLLGITLLLTACVGSILVGDASSQATCSQSPDCPQNVPPPPSQRYDRFGIYHWLIDYAGMGFPLVNPLTNAPINGLDNGNQLVKNMGCPDIASSENARWLSESVEAIEAYGPASAVWWQVGDSINPTDTTQFIYQSGLFSGITLPSGAKQPIMTAAGNAFKYSDTGDEVWVEDDAPAGAVKVAEGGDSWNNWVSVNPRHVSGTQALQSSSTGVGMHQLYFTNAQTTLAVNAGDTLFAYIFIDPTNPPTEVMLQWREGASFEHRAFWGTESTFWAALNTDGMRYMGPIPNSWLNRWVRLEVPASLVGLEGKTLNGMAFTLFGGSATWDSAGKIKQARLDQ